jgi:uncharacterized protein
MLPILVSGSSSLATYLAGHVVLCLLPALFIAGGISALVPQAAVTRWLGARAAPHIAYPVAAVGGFFLAVCSCTILPLFSSIYRRGAGIGPAVTFLFVGPAINILAVSLTSVQLGVDFAIARLVLSIVFGIGIGAALARMFRAPDAGEQRAGADPFAAQARLDRRGLVVVALSLGVLLAGTVPGAWASFELVTVPLPALVHDAQRALSTVIPAQPALGVEGLSVHGVVLIALLVALGAVAWRALRELEPQTRAILAVGGAAAFVLLVASLSLRVAEGAIAIVVTTRSLVLAVSLAALVAAVRRLDDYERGAWFQESWRFTKQIVPLLLVGVFFAGAARELVPESAVRAIAGENTVTANLLATLFGAVLYFPTLVEVPVAHTLLSLGMHKGPLLAYLMADPELSVQSLLVTSKVIGRRKTLAYVLLIILAATVAGLIFGAYVA